MITATVATSSNSLSGTSSYTRPPTLPRYPTSSPPTSARSPQALRRDNTLSERHRLLRNLAQVATLTGRLAYDDLGDSTAGRAHYALALDSAAKPTTTRPPRLRSATPRSSPTPRQPAAALAHLTAPKPTPNTPPPCCPGSPRSRLPCTPTRATSPLPATHLTDGVLTELAAVLGHAHPHAGHPVSEAREYLTGALDQLSTTRAHRHLPTPCRHATAARAP